MLQVVCSLLQEVNILYCALAWCYTEGDFATSCHVLVIGLVEHEYLCVVESNDSLNLVGSLVGNIDKSVYYTSTACAVVDKPFVQLQIFFVWGDNGNIYTLTGGGTRWSVIRIGSGKMRLASYNQILLVVNFGVVVSKLYVHYCTHNLSF